MIRGTVLIVGRSKRELDILIARLERDNFQMAKAIDGPEALSWLKKNRPQAILFDVAGSARDLESLINKVRGTARIRHIPIIIVANDEVPATLMRLKSVGEVFRLHCSPLSEIVKRFNRAIQLAQLASSH